MSNNTDNTPTQFLQTPDIELAVVGLLIRIV